MVRLPLKVTASLLVAVAAQTSFASEPVISSVRANVIQVAISHLGRHDDDPSCGNRGCYFAGNGNWCSEFVATIYREAGVPFTDGRGQSPKFLNNTRKIRKWFKARNAYVNRQSQKWNSFVPLPGDYVFIGRAGEPSRAHSGIVEFVDDEGTLHTIEGNNSGAPVTRFVYPDYKINSTHNGSANGIVLGFGAREF